ncbi:hypothetical protein BB14905_18915 [Bacillus sp. B14905]|nr:hypothetical protein BB14905_18915 [Bacillus sp. B14905]
MMAVYRFGVTSGSATLPAANTLSVTINASVFASFIQYAK